MREQQRHVRLEGIVESVLAQLANSAIVQRAVAQLPVCSYYRKLTKLLAGVTNHSLLIGVAGWETKLVEKLPKELKGSLPSVEEIEAELADYPKSAPRPPRKRR